MVDGDLSEGSGLKEEKEGEENARSARNFEPRRSRRWEENGRPRRFMGRETNLEVKSLLESEVSSDGDDGEESSNGDLDGRVGVGLFWFGEGKEVNGPDVLSLWCGRHEDEESLVDGLGDERSEGGLFRERRGKEEESADAFSFRSSQ